MINEFSKVKKYLCYVLTACEMESGGFSGWSYYCVAQGNTPEEIVHNWIDNVKLLYGVDLSNELRINEDTKYISIQCYKFCMNELEESIYGDSQELNIEFPYRKHSC